MHTAAGSSGVFDHQPSLNAGNLPPRIGRIGIAAVAGEIESRNGT
jgi:hypothetical protein